MDATISDTSMGLMKAFHFLIQQQRREVTPKFTYAPKGSAVHAARCLSKGERAVVNKIVGELAALNSADPENSDRIRELIKEISAQPVKFIPVKRESRIDTAKTYPYRSTKRGG